MEQNIALMVAGLCLFVLGAMALPDNFAMPADEEGNFWFGAEAPRQSTKIEKDFFRRR